MDAAKLCRHLAKVLGLLQTWMTDLDEIHGEDENRSRIYNCTLEIRASCLREMVEIDLEGLWTRFSEVTQKTLSAKYLPIFNAVPVGLWQSPS